MELTDNPLRQWREAAGYSQQALGVEIGGATDKTVRSWEGSKTVIQTRYRRRLAEALGRDIDDIMAVVRYIEDVRLTAAETAAAETAENIKAREEPKPGGPQSPRGG